MGKRAGFYEKIGLNKTLDNVGLKCFPLGDKELAIHEEIPGDPRKVIISLLVDDLESFVRSLREKGIEFEGPTKSHLGTEAISLSDPEGFGLEFHQKNRSDPQQDRFF